MAVHLYKLRIYGSISARVRIGLTAKTYRFKRIGHFSEKCHSEKKSFGYIKANLFELELGLEKVSERDNIALLSYSFQRISVGVLDRALKQAL